MGDLVEKVTEVTGIKSVIKGLTDDCGCDARRDKLNRMFRFYTPMTEEQKKVWEGIRSEVTDWENFRISVEAQRVVNALYAEVFKVRIKTTRCGSCFGRRMKALEDVYQLCVS